MKSHYQILRLLLTLVLVGNALGWARFQEFIDEDINPADDPGGEIQINYWWGDTIRGSLHSNDDIKINGVEGYPQFLGLVSTARDDVMWINGTTPNYSIFEGGLWLNYPDSRGIPLPTFDSILETTGGVGLPILCSPVYIDSLVSYEEIATALHIRDNHLMIEQWLHDHFTPDGDTIYYEERYPCYSELPLPPPEQGTVFLNGKLFLEGRLTGQVTFLAADTIWLIDDVYYSDVEFDGVDFPPATPEDEKGRPPAGSSNRMGIISAKNVIVAFNAQNGGYNGGQGGPGPNCEATEGVLDREHILITAAVMALDNVFEVDFWHNSCTFSAEGNPYGLPPGDPCHTGYSDLRGNIYLWGSLIQQRRGFIRRSPIGPYGQRLIGYDKRYHYDENFAISFPPCFPELWDTLRVPAEYATIQAAIDSAGSGDVIVVEPGVYQENLVIDSKDIFLTSRYQMDGDSTCIETTVIDGGGCDAVIRLQDCYYLINRICGFTLTNGVGFQPDTSEYTYGGGICCMYADPTLESLIITGNSADFGGGIYFWSDGEMASTLGRVTVVNNTAVVGGGLFQGYGGLRIHNSIFWNNYPESFPPGHNYSPVSCCDIEGGWWGENNIDADPMFCNPEGGNYRLGADSPCRSDTCGIMGYTGAYCDPEPVDGFVSHPPTFYLSQNHPNPVNPSTTIEFGLPVPAEVELVAYNIRGQIVDVIQSGFTPAGFHSLVWRPEGLASGVYLLQLRAGDRRAVKKVMYVK